MRNQLIDLDQHKHELTKKQLRTEYVHSFALYADDVGIPVEIEYQHQPSQNETCSVCDKYELNLLLSLVNVTVAG